jgi:hypothetical protein
MMIRYCERDEMVRRYDDNRADHAGQVAIVVDGLAV